MIATIRGRVAGRFESSAIIDVGGIGYRVWMPGGAIASLPADGDEVSVFTHLHVREDELTLYAFPSPAEQRVFERLITVSGVGPKVALAILSAMSADELATAIEAEDIASLTAVPGIGKKTAQRICLELRDKIAESGGVTTGRGTSKARDEAMAALLAMGFSSAEATTALNDAPDEDARSMARWALKRLGAPR